MDRYIYNLEIDPGRTYRVIFDVCFDAKRYVEILNRYIEHIELPTKLIDYFLRSNKSNINQIVKTVKSYDLARYAK